MSKAKKNGSAGGDEAIWHSARGTVHIGGLDDGEEIVCRFRTHEIATLEERRGKGILSMLNEESLGLGFLRDALLVGSAHMFIGKKGKQKKTLTEDRVNRWIDRCEDNGVEFQELLQSVVKAVVSGMPGGDKYVEMMEEGEEDEDGDDPKGGSGPRSQPAA